MAKEWKQEWKASVQPRSQRKYRANAPKHMLRRFLSTHLSPSLRGKYQRRSFPVRVGDTVKVMRGQFSGVTGKVSRISLREGALFVDGASFTKKDGTKIARGVDASNVILMEMDLGDKRRTAALKRAAGSPGRKGPEAAAEAGKAPARKASDRKTRHEG